MAKNIVAKTWDFTGTPRVTYDSDNLDGEGPSTPATAVLTGTMLDATMETDIVSGGRTIIITIDHDTLVADGATFNAQRQAIINGITASATPTNGWNNEVRDNEVVTAVVRTSDTVVTITLTAAASYDITATEVITDTFPAAALVTSVSAVVATPNFSVTATGSWQLPSANYYSTPAQFDPVIVSPRPDADTDTQSNHRLAYTGIEFDHPVIVYGASFPVHFELTANTTATGATIGNDLTLSGGILVAGIDYGRVKWTPAGSGSETIEVLVTDQDGRTAIISWTVVAGISTDDFVFFSTSGNDSNTGAIGSPVTITDLASGDHAGKKAYGRTGTHVLDWSDLDTGTTPRSIIGYPGETVEISLANQRFSINGQDDIAMGHLTLSSNPATITKQIVIIGSQSSVESQRHVYYDIIYSGMRDGGGSNGGCFAILGGDSRYIGISRPELTGNMGQFITGYLARTLVIEHMTGDANVNISSTGNHGVIFLKDNCYEWTVRNCDMSGFTITAQTSCIAVGTQSNRLTQDNDFSYNRLPLPTTTFPLMSFKELEHTGTYNENAFIYRCTMKGNYREFAAGATGISITCARNVLGDTFDLKSPNTWTTLDENLTSNSDIDSDLNLTGTTRTTYLGIRGAEIAS